MGMARGLEVRREAREGAALALRGVRGRPAARRRRGLVALVLVGQGRRRVRGREPERVVVGDVGVVVAPTTQGHWAVMPLPEDQLRALSLRAFARAKAQGVRPTRVRNKDPLKPLPVPGKFFRPIIDADRPPPRPKDGIGI